MALPPTARSTVLVLAVALAASLIVAPPRAAASDAEPVSYTAPVDGPVVDGFRPPSTPYGPGNRGLEYDTAPGTPVRAAAAGVVTFAGPVAGALYVTVLHADGVRTTYSYLRSIAVHADDAVQSHEMLGAAGDRLLFTARLGDAYLDPAILLAAAPLAVHLVPDASPPSARGPSPPQEPPGRLTAAAVAWARGRFALATSRAWAHYLAELTPAPHLLRLAGAARDWLRRRTSCTPAATAPPRAPPGRVALLVGGLGSTSDLASVDRLDTSKLGYARPDVLRFSYAGGLVPDAGDRPLPVEVTEYTSGDTGRDLVGAGTRLADTIAAIAGALPPGTTLDVVAHSQGGVVAHLALAVLARRGDRRTLDALGAVVTLASPHSGSDLATAVSAVAESPAGAGALEALQAASGIAVEPRAAAVGQLSEVSALTAALWSEPVPAGVRVTSIGVRGDLVVPAGRTVLAGAVNVVVDGVGPRAHDDLPASSSATREIALALAGLPPTCESLLDALGDAVVGDAIGWAEDAAGAAALAAAMAAAG